MTINPRVKLSLEGHKACSYEAMRRGRTAVRPYGGNTAPQPEGWGMELDGCHTLQGVVLNLGSYVSLTAANWVATMPTL